MTTSKTKPKRPVKSQPALTPFAAMALRAMRKAQRTAARENARYGMRLIVRKSC